MRSALKAMITKVVSVSDSSSLVPSTWELDPDNALPTVDKYKYWLLPAKLV